VNWPLQWVDDPLGPGACAVAWHAGPVADDGVVLRHGRLTAWWRELGAAVPVRGALVADTHGQVPERVPPVPGRVVRVQVVVQTWQLVPPRTYVPVDGEFTLRAVERSPRWFDGGDHGDATPAVSVSESGVLVGLRLEPGPH
jgi:hypothetical protein